MARVERRSGSSAATRSSNASVTSSTTDEPYVTFVHGVAGVGKTSLLQAFAAEARTAGRDGRPAGLPLARADRSRRPRRPRECARGPGRDDRGHREATLAVAGAGGDRPRSLRSAPARGHVVASDVRPADAEQRRLVVAGREPPVAAWLTAPELAGQVDRIPLEPLRPDDAIDLFVALGVASHGPSASTA